ncbi:O-antigen ligase family protein [Candidatus Microgenomates bacterium]|nr:O-antigen ligase family protein [Candidatus Microgenomates bacterium]
MKYLLVILFCIFPFGQLLRLNLGSGVVIHVNDIFVGFIFLLSLVNFKKNKLLKPILLWVGVMVFSLVINFSHYTLNQLLISSLYILRWISYAGLFFLFSDFKDKSFIKRGLTLAVLGVAIAGIAQYLLLPNVSFLAADDWDNHYFRLVSTFLDPGFTGAILALGLVLNFNPVVFTAVLLTYSRATYLLYLANFAALSFFKKSVKIFLLTTLAIFLALPLLPKTFGEGTKLVREASSWSRIENWKLGLEVWKKSPLFGVGYNSFRYASNAPDKSHAGAGVDSSLILVLATTGVVGLVVYLYLLKSLWCYSPKNIIFKASFVGILIHSWFNNTLFYPWVMEWLWLLLVVA